MIDGVEKKERDREKGGVLRMIDDGVEGGSKQASHTQRAAQILCQTIPPHIFSVIFNTVIVVQSHDMDH